MLRNRSTFYLKHIICLFSLKTSRKLRFSGVSRYNRVKLLHLKMHTVPVKYSEDPQCKEQSIYALRLIPYIFLAKERFKAQFIFKIKCISSLTSGFSTNTTRVFHVEKTISFPQNFHTRKLGEITVFYAVQVLITVIFSILSTNFAGIISRNL